LTSFLAKKNKGAMPLFFLMNTIKKYWFFVLPISVICVMWLYKKWRARKADSSNNFFGFGQNEQGASVLDTVDESGSIRQKTDQQLAVMADAIEVAIYGGSGWQVYEDDDVVFNQLIQITTNADFVRLIQIWGTRGGGVFSNSQTLIEAVNETLDADLLNQLRTIYSGYGITI
jgi:hypothetical protein